MSVSGDRTFVLSDKAFSWRGAPVVPHSMNSVVTRSIIKHKRLRNLSVELDSQQEILTRSQSQKRAGGLYAGLNQYRYEFSFSLPALHCGIDR